MNNKTKIGLILISLIAISSQAYALSFGTHVKENEISLYRGQTGSFELSFFSRDEDSVIFMLSLEEYPKDFRIIYPENFELNSGSSDEYILIENEYFKVSTLNVYVEVPKNAEFGTHRILLKASSFNQDGQQGSLGVNAEKTFLLKVNVLGGTPPIGQITTIENTGEPEEVVENEGREEIVPSEVYEENNETSAISGMFLLNSERIILFSVFVIIIILISFLIYKKTFSPKK